MRISLCGAAGEVTGSGYLVQTAKATVLVDFGMFQGRGATEARNLDLGPVKPLALDAIVVTHAASRPHGAAAALAVPRLSRGHPSSARKSRCERSLTHSAVSRPMRVRPSLSNGPRPWLHAVPVSC